MKSVARFLSLNKYAVAGVSRNPKKSGRVMFRELRKKGMDVVPVNPNVDLIDGEKCFRTVSDLPADVRGLILMTPKQETLAVAREAMAHGINDIWIQQGAETRSTIGELEKEEINLISNQCIMMFWKPDSVHSFHRFLKKIFVGLPA